MNLHGHSASLEPAQELTCACSKKKPKPKQTTKKLRVLFYLPSFPSAV